VQLTTVTRDVIAEAGTGAVMRQTLKPATYLVAVTASPRGGGAYTVSVLVRVVMKTTLKADGKSKLTVDAGSPSRSRRRPSPSPRAAPYRSASTTSSRGRAGSIGNRGVFTPGGA
jgi:hypothetical protein